MTTGWMLALAAACGVAAIAAGPRSPRAWLGLNLGGTAAVLAAAVAVLGGASWEWRGGIAIGGEPLHLRLDALSAMFLALVAVVAGAATVYAAEYWPDRLYPDSAPRNRAWWSTLLLSLGWVLVSSNGLHFLIGWELFTVSAYFLITLDRARPEVRRAGWLFLVASHAGTACLFAFFATLAARTGSWDLGPMRDRAELAPLFWLVLAGFGVKAGIFPLHVWLPSAHANAPSHVSAMMSGVAVKMGIYGLLRFSGWLPVPAAAGWVVLGVGAISALLGIAFALAQDDLKRLLAYCTVENVGIILTGLGAALLAAAQGDAPWGRLALAGALFHIWNHAAFKSLLFFSAGSVLHATGTREMSRLGGLWRVMPWTTALFGLAALAVAGLPPLNGFVSEWLVYLGLFSAVAERGPAAWATLPAAIMLASAGALALATFVKAASVVFLGAPRSTAAVHAHECGPGMRGPMVLLAVICLGLGLVPALFWPALGRAAGVWHPAWVQAAAPAPLATLGVVQLVLAVGAAAATAWLWFQARGNGVRRGPTWDCGYVAPAARMQYTSGSFGGIVGGWFGWLLQPERRLRRPRGPWPQEASRVERIPETVLERVFVPAGSRVLQTAAVMRRLQHGRLQFYVLYVVIGLAALAALAVTGGRP
ncbi:MAG TPA: proton-conducting transporter membrane subunit [Lacunisphaera sp.]|jgi:hydrogenase-4 component B|nr:proton-conducting transporter membrane subunit [Lacunisphaera sp.]